MEEDIIEIQVIAKGKVQGVGFRATTSYHATRIGIKGTVCNLPTGEVEIYAQGTPSKIDQLLQCLRQDLGSVNTFSFTQMQVSPRQYDGFSIIFARQR